MFFINNSQLLQHDGRGEVIFVLFNTALIGRNSFFQIAHFHIGISQGAVFCSTNQQVIGFEFIQVIEWLSS